MKKDIAGESILTEHQFILPALERLSEIEPGNVQQVVASQIELMNVYHDVVLEQARRSFIWALVAAGVGLLFFIVAIGVSIMKGPTYQSATFVSVIGGVLTEFISAINFMLYGKTANQMAEFQQRLDQTQRFLLANSICEGLEGDAKQEARSHLVKVISGHQTIQET